MLACNPAQSNDFSKSSLIMFKSLQIYYNIQRRHKKYTIGAVSANLF